MGAPTLDAEVAQPYQRRRPVRPDGGTGEASGPSSFQMPHCSQCPDCPSDVSMPRRRSGPVGFPSLKRTPPQHPPPAQPVPAQVQRGCACSHAPIRSGRKNRIGPRSAPRSYSSPLAPCSFGRPAAPSTRPIPRVFCSSAGDSGGLVDGASCEQPPSFEAPDAATLFSFPTGRNRTRGRTLFPLGASAATGVVTSGPILGVDEIDHPAILGGVVHPVSPACITDWSRRAETKGDFRLWKWLKLTGPGSARTALRN